MTTHSATAPTGIAPRDESNFRHSIFHGGRKWLGGAFDSIGRFFQSLAASQQAAARYDRLVQLSDAELAERGVSREDIPRLVFRQYFGH